MQMYDQGFYDWQMSGSYRSAKIFLGHLFQYGIPSSVLDFGCGRGTWLAACAEFNIQTLLGVDGPWNSQEQMMNPAIRFIPADLNKAFASPTKVDLAISLEVAEHVEPESSENFVNSLVGAADAILFGAAFTGQPGTHHVNTRPHSFWVEKFLAQGYVYFDLFRPAFWDNDQVEPWYRQNTFLFVRPSHSYYNKLTAAGHQAHTTPSFVNCVHPWLYYLALNEIGNLRAAAAK